MMDYNFVIWCRTIEVGADRFKVPDVLFNPALVQVKFWDIYQFVYIYLISVLQVLPT